MEISQVNEYGRQLEKIIKSYSRPFALKWCESVSDVPENAIFPTRDLGKHMALCQAFAYCRNRGMTIAMTTRDHWCWNPLIGYGAVECLPGQPSFDEIVRFIGIPEKDKAEAFFAQFPRLPLHKYEAIVMAPLSEATFIPDVVMVYASPFQVNYLVRCVKPLIGGSFMSEFDGIDSCIYCTVPSFLKGEFRVTLPDPGETERARTEDDEVIFTIPGTKLEGYMEELLKRSARTPCDRTLREIQLDFPRPGFYNKLFEMWGLEQSDELPPPQK